ncbi:alkaline phosphatase family protein (plasmid) [Hymenobacter sp. NBH84]|uniref:alkaline phosphatase family protein n=1 Tax=Hymenobacter sp. NBH84 TaxID=2596915 RepID=UPI0016256667|nr:alkaline phosphatase family protein [Hymenobacter sp. NBH84]QNE42334.1 alkaline phosphatase family protein [Hymenobacter sp. NBH84]
MKKSLLFVCAALLTHVATAQQRSPKVVFIIADGIPADVIEKASVPNIRKVIAAGTYLRAHVGGDQGTYTETPTISAPGYNNLLTGTWGYKHNVWGNSIKAPNYQYKTIFRLLKDQQPTKKTAIFSTWLDNRTKLVGEGLPATGNLRVDYRADGYELDTIAYPHDKQSQYIHAIDERVVEEAVKTLTAKGPDLSWVYLEYTDDMGHRHGDSEQQQQAIAYLDAQVGRLWDAVQTRQKKYKEDWLLVLTTDHGRDPQTGRNHGGQSARERATWVVVSTKNVNAYAQQPEPVAIVDILPTISRFMQLSLPQTTQRELDGVPLLGPVSLAQPQVQIAGDSLRITWKALGPKTEKVKVWLTATNDFQTGGQDRYTLLGTVPLARQSLSVSRKQYPAEFYKIVLEGEHNTVNRWLTNEKPGPKAQAD